MDENEKRLFLEGDRVIHIEKGRHGVVTQDQPDENDTVAVMWDDGYSPAIFYPAENLRMESDYESD
jgi:hypothetical protein